MIFWIMIIGAAIYIVCNLITGRGGEPVDTVIKCIGVMGLITFGVGLFHFLAGGGR